MPAGRHAPSIRRGLPARAAVALMLPAIACAVEPPVGETGTTGDMPPPGIAGSWFGSLPVPECGPADILLQLQADGRYTLQGHCRASMQALPDERGQWSVEWNGTCARLVPAGGALPGAGPRPREFALAMDDLMVLAEGSCIEPVDDPRGRSLHRALDVD